MAHSLFIIVSVPLPCNSVGTSSLLFSIFDGHSPARGARRWVAFWTPKYLPGWRPCEADSRGSRRGGGVWRRRDRGKPIFITRTQEYSIKSAARWLLGAPPFRHPFPSAIHDHHHQYRPIIYRPFIQADPMAWWHKGGIPGPHLRGLRPVLPPCPINVLAINWLPVNFVLAASPARKSLKKAPQTSVQGRLWFMCISRESGVPMRNKIYKNKPKSCEPRSWRNARRSPEGKKWNKPSFNSLKMQVSE